MVFELPLGAPAYREVVGKTCAIIDVDHRVPVQPGDHLVDPRGHVWAVDHRSEGIRMGLTRLTLFCSTTSATLKQNEEIRLYELPVPQQHRQEPQLR